MNIKKALINRMVGIEALEIQKELISFCDNKLKELHIARVNDDPLRLHCKDDAALQERYEYYIDLRRKVNIPIKEFILLDNEELGLDFEKFCNRPKGEFKPVADKIDCGCWRD